MKTATDTKGRIWRIDHVIKGLEARKAQIQPGYVQVNISPIDSKTSNHSGISLPELIADRWIEGAIKVKVS